MEMIDLDKIMKASKELIDKLGYELIDTVHVNDSLNYCVCLHDDVLEIIKIRYGVSEFPNYEFPITEFEKVLLDFTDSLRDFMFKSNMRVIPGVFDFNIVGDNRAICRYTKTAC